MIKYNVHACILLVKNVRPFIILVDGWIVGMCDVMMKIYTNPNYSEEDQKKGEGKSRKWVFCVDIAEVK